ncbi:MBL fold metallo-hydrolase [Propionivibrio dicarboxylicus]|uniref:Glyoxylase, beta-lactamase superfamily II n=1 Tax=Propionivibrio dicarboxylicus TaxID=83767 RepID=A0A1G8JCT8_9RHOO|nr:MBL fold metallo-hydrolase [Propionivibrio dicarboxylicus]SDI29055.1 Glyoxylase, beta-lactamase superfamily II [Propionivibrio dicarboxylicus]
MPIKYQTVPVTPFEQNCSILWCSETMKAAIVDPGGNINRILAAIEKNGLTPERILVTHGHIDHAGGVAELSEKLSVPVEGPQREDAFWIEGMPAQSKLYGFPGVRAFIPDRWLEQDDVVRFGNVELKVLHCPGHTPGHVAFFNEPGRLLLVGDVLFKGSIGRTDFPKGDFDTLIASIHDKLWPLGDDVAFISGHGPMSTIGYERRHNPFCGG